MVAVRDQLLETDEALEGLPDKILALLEVVEALPVEGEEATVDSDATWLISRTRASSSATTWKDWLGRRRRSCGTVLT